MNNAPSLQGKTFVFLGSSVTYGSGAAGYSMAEHIATTEGCTVIKEAVSGTTLVDNGPDSYVSRLVNQATATCKNTAVDGFVVQLSTNDATRNLPLGAPSQSFDLADFDTSTIIGAIEFIIAYVKKTWNCPVSFYTGTRYDSEAYHDMVEALGQIQTKWGVGVIDLYHDPDMNAVTEEDYRRFMADPVHPTREGYEIWWTPKFVEHLKQYP